jgi:hypothetical protein
MSTYSMYSGLTHENFALSLDERRDVDGDRDPTDGLSGSFRLVGSVGDNHDKGHDTDFHTAAGWDWAK